ncbi:MAG: hypothetical protein ACLS4Z_07555 [Christensenellaceae bacterium]
MLQQTRVEAARDYYLRFLRELPDVEALAECEEDRLLKLWEGLGYYSRVRNMQKAAKLVVEKYGGDFPREEKALKALPGIGEYTAGAILSIAYGLPVPAVDGNVFRVLSRLSENPTDISEPAYRNYLAEKLRAVYPATARGVRILPKASWSWARSSVRHALLVRKMPLNGLCRARARHADAVSRSAEKGKAERKGFRLSFETRVGSRCGEGKRAS